MARRLGNASVSSLLKQAQSAYERQQSYNDSIASYEYELSDKTEADYNNYQKYLRERQSKVTDAAKKLELEKKITSAYRTFNSSEIQRATLAVNYGDINKTQKYNTMYGLLQRAIQNGDMELAGNIESQMASLSVQIQNEAAAAAGRGGGRGSGSSSAYSAVKQQINDFENKIDRAYQTGQPLVIDGKNIPLDAAAYAVYQAQVLKSKYQLLSAQAQEDPKYADDLSSLQKSSEWRGLIDSGLVQFDGDKLTVSEGIKNLAVKFKQDSYGNTSRTFSAPPLKDGKAQVGLVAGEDGQPAGRFIVERQLDNTTTDPSLKSRVEFNAKPYYDDNGNQIQGTLERYSGNARGDLISGNRVLIDQATGLNSASYVGKKETRTPDQAKKALDELVNAKPYTPGPLDGVFDALNESPAAKIPKFDYKSPFAQSALRFGSTAAGAAMGFGAAGGILSGLVNRSQQESYKRELEARARAAEAARQQSIREAYARQQAAATQAAQRAATPAPRIVPTAPKSNFYLPTAYASPAQVFNSSLGNNKSNANIAKSLGKAVGYNF